MGPLPEVLLQARMAGFPASALRIVPGALIRASFAGRG